MIDRLVCLDVDGCGWMFIPWFWILAMAFLAGFWGVGRYGDGLGLGLGLLWDRQG